MFVECLIICIMQQEYTILQNLTSRENDRIFEIKQVKFFTLSAKFFRRER